MLQRTHRLLSRQKKGQGGSIFRFVNQKKMTEMNRGALANGDGQDAWLTDPALYRSRSQAGAFQSTTRST